MAIQNFIPTVWSARLNATLEKAHVFGAVANRDYEGEITGFGDTVKINGVGEITIGDYIKNVTEITPEELNGLQTILNIDQSKYFAFKVDDVDKAQQNPKVMEQAMRNAAHGLKDASDRFLAGLHAQAGSTLGDDVTPIGVDSKNVIQVLAEVGQKLTENDNPMDERFLVIPSWLHTKLVLARILQEGNNTQVFDNGFVGRALGFDIYVSNNVANTGNAKYKVMGGTKRALSFAEQVLNIEAYRPESSFSDAVKGLYVFGGKVVNPESLVTLTADMVAEA